MGGYNVLKAAGHRIDDIYLYTVRTWGRDQAERYITGLFDHFQQIADRTVPWRPIPAEFGVSGYFSRYEKHFVYFKELSTGEIGIATVLHQSMDKAGRLKEDSQAI